MKGDESFRLKSKAFLQSANEVVVYKKIIPYFQTFMAKAGVFFDDWTAQVYFADCAIFPELSKLKETILALEDLNDQGFRLSEERMDLDTDHLTIMARKIASYHAVSFALKIQKDPKLDELAAELIPFHFQSETQGDLETYKYLCPLSFDRLFRYIYRERSQQSEEFLRDLKNLKEKVENNFLNEMEDLLRNDHDFAVILHGDYYRNNVMFKYVNEGGKDVPVDLRMFDFQETRYATVGIDLSIFMFMHVHAELKPLIWDNLLQIYHATLMSKLQLILKCDSSDERLSPYSFEKFISHFEKVAFYGAAVSILSIPWMASPEEDTKKIQDFFEIDMNHPEFKRLLEVCGGEDVNERLLDNIKHCSDKGYLKIFNE